MNSFMIRIAPVLGSVAVFGAAQADVLWNQPWNSSGQLTISQNDTSSGGLGNFDSAFDNFTPSSGWSITEIDWTGGFFPGHGPITAFTIGFYNDDGAGLPGSFITSDSVAAASDGETSLGTVGGHPMYSYSASLSFAASANTTYWISIVPDLALPTEWGWATGTGGDGQSFQFQQGVVGLSPQNHDLAFTLVGSNQGRFVTPEPFTMSLGVAGLALFVRRRAKKS